MEYIRITNCFKRQNSFRWREVICLYLQEEKNMFDKPIYNVFTILDLSKLNMSGTYYDNLQPFVDPNLE